MTFFEQIYIYFLPKQQVLPHKKDGQMSVVSVDCGKGLIYQNKHC